MRIGILGAGQLGQMLGFAARGLGYECCFVDPSDSPPAASAGQVIRAAFDDENALATLAERCDVITYEFENVPVAALASLTDKVPVYPPLKALRKAQDRLSEKRLFDELDIPVPDYQSIDTRADLDNAINEFGLPVVVKTRRFGYDGKGQVVIRDASELDDVWRSLDSRAAIAEAWVNFDLEVSILGARNPRGEMAIWPLSSNEHVGGILRTTRAPLDNDVISARAETYMQRLLKHLDYVGVLALELFVVDDSLLANEYAPRVHNSGHWTIEGAETSQFTNHLLTITGRTPRPTAARGYAGMVNLIGSIPDAIREISGPGSALHDYGKTPRPDRKLGHITVVADTAAKRDDRLAEICKTVTQSTGD
ncbi:MAG: 5-(carboxyamino)imidazole ribonucleotide synthase [Gammaproteobacteria bacterium]|nr:5-(carboxyamino)imidazole ribonucleotide synthase [Gammaproteobacteria bacterium]